MQAVHRLQLVLDDLTTCRLSVVWRVLPPLLYCFSPSCILSMLAASFWSDFGPLFSNVAAQKASSCGFCRPNVPFSRPELFAWAGLQAASVPGLISGTHFTCYPVRNSCASFLPKKVEHQHRFFFDKIRAIWVLECPNMDSDGLKNIIEREVFQSWRDSCVPPFSKAHNRKEEDEEMIKHRSLEEMASVTRCRCVQLAGKVVLMKNSSLNFAYFFN